jgi:hypothetical protein
MPPAKKHDIIEAISVLRQEGLITEFHAREPEDPQDKLHRHATEMANLHHDHRKEWWAFRAYTILLAATALTTIILVFLPGSPESLRAAALAGLLSIVTGTGVHLLKGKGAKAE